MRITALNSLTAIIRIFYREQAFALINLFSLSLAVACCLILGLYLRSELTYDQHHLNHERIYRVANEFTLSGPPDRLAESQVPLGPLLKENVPEIEAYARFQNVGENILIRSGDQAYFWDDVYRTDPGAFSIFTHDILYGDPATALRDPGSVAVSLSFARKYFGDANPIGASIIIGIAPEVPRRISLVFKDLPENTHLKYSVLFLLEDPPDYRPYLFNVSVFTYVLMPAEYDIEKFPGNCARVFDRYMAEQARRQNIAWRCWLEPLADIHLNSDLLFDVPAGNRYYIYGFTAVAVFILLVACINYINLAIARATRRAKEIGLRKILGASRKHLVMRFLGEALVFAFIALVVGVVFVKLALAWTPVSVLLGKPLTLDLLQEPVLLLWLAGLGILIGVCAGSYPAFFLSAFSPLSALVATSNGRPGGFRLREMLVLVQFMVSVIVIASTLVMSLQMRYIAGLPMGFAQENRVVINLQGLDVIENFDLIKDALLTDGRILGVSHTWAMISTDQMVPLGPGQIANRDGVLETTSFGVLAVEEDFLEVMDIKLVEGRNFSQRYLTDVGAAFLVNETMVTHRGWAEPIGKQVQYNNARGKVVGVVKDFHIQSARHEIEPVILFLDEIDFSSIPREARPGFRRLMVVHLSGQEVDQALSFIQQTMARFDPAHPFVYTFLDQSVGSLYQSDERLMQMTGIFSLICIFIACLGLFGLTAFTTEQRRKEIGIRKVLGATAVQVIMVLARKILWLIIAGSIIASLIAYFAINEWLAGFAYRTSIQLWVFLISTATVTAVAYATVALQTYRTAMANPSRAIRYE